MLADPRRILAISPDAAGEALFDPQFWAARGDSPPVGAGRGAAWFIASGPEHWVLRHYRRGGFMARISAAIGTLGRRGAGARLCGVPLARAPGSARPAGAGAGRGALPAPRT